MFVRFVLGLSVPNLLVPYAGWYSICDCEPISHCHQWIVLFLWLIQNVLFLMGMINAEPDPIPALCVQYVIYSELKVEIWNADMQGSYFNVSR